MAEKVVKKACDGNEAAAYVAYAMSEVAAIFPISPSSAMAEQAEAWMAAGKKNVFGRPVNVMQMQSESGAAGAIHGSLVGGALTTTFTASQGLLLMLPVMHKIAGELLPTVFHVSARTVATHALSIFGDHSDVMSIRNTGFGMLCSNNNQEVMDLALVSHLASLKSSVPFVSFFDGFRTSNEIEKIEFIPIEAMQKLLNPADVDRFRKKALRPEAPTVKAGSQNPDIFFQSREGANKYYDALPQIVQEKMDAVAKITGRSYHLFDYYGAKDATSVIVLMGSGVDTARKTAEKLNKEGRKLGVISVRLYRPFFGKAFVEALPKSAQKVIVLDRTKEAGALGDPLYLDVKAALSMYGRSDASVYGGRYGLGGKEFDPAMVKAVYDFGEAKPFHDFTVGIEDDVTKRSIPVTDPDFSVEDGADLVSAIFWGLGSDGTVGANKNSIKIIAEGSDLNTQGYVIYDSKKSGSVTESHLRFGHADVSMPWLIKKADFVACHNESFLGEYDIFESLKDGGKFLLNSIHPASEVMGLLTEKDQKIVRDRHIKFYTIDALKIANEAGLKGKISTAMQAAFFSLSTVIPPEQAIRLMKEAVYKTFFKKGQDIVDKNYVCIDSAAHHIEQVDTSQKAAPASVGVDPTKGAEDPYIRTVLGAVNRRHGDNLKVSELPEDGVMPMGTVDYNKFGIAAQVPRWIPENCIQCNICSQSCPHGVIVAKQISPADLKGAPSTFNTLKSKTKNESDLQFKIQVSVNDCTGCGVCIQECPAKNKALAYSPIETEREKGEEANWDFFDALPENVTEGADPKTFKGLQFKQNYFHFSGACAGCGETPYIKLATQLVGDQMIIANATGCSSIYGGTAPAVPYRASKTTGRGPAWGNSLFEDNAEYGLGMRLAVDSNRATLKGYVEEYLTAHPSGDVSSDLKRALKSWDAQGDEAIENQRQLKDTLAAAKNKDELLSRIYELSDYFTDKSVWCFGGDGWAYDIGYGGLDHVIASGKNVNILILDTEVYSNTGGQKSKSTPFGAVAKFAWQGKRQAKKQLTLMAMSYGYVYVGVVAMGANRLQVQKAMEEAIAYDGPSIILAYAPCIAHGFDMMMSQQEEKKAVESGYWPLFRFNPAETDDKKFIWDGPKSLKLGLGDFVSGERRFTALKQTAPKEHDLLTEEFKRVHAANYALLKRVGQSYNSPKEG